MIRLILLLLLLGGCTYQYAASPAAPVPSPPPPPPVYSTAGSYYESAAAVYELAPAAGIAKPRAVRKPIIVQALPIIAPDDVVDQLREASMMFTLPKSTNINNPVEARLVIDSTKNASELTIPEALQGEVKNIKISKVVSANIVANDFKVNSLTATKQAISFSDQTVWIWELVPLKEGSRKVSVTVTAFVEVDGEKIERQLVTYTREMYVEVTPQQKVQTWFKSYWQWLSTTLLIPIALWIRKRYFQSSSESST